MESQETFSELFEATKPGKVSTSTEVLLDVKKICGNRVPLVEKSFDGVYDTSRIYDLLKNGAYLFEGGAEQFVVTAEDAAKVVGFTEALQNLGSSTVKFKIGRKTFKLHQPWYLDEAKVDTKVSQLHIEGEQAENVIPNELSAETKKMVKEQVIVYAMKVPLSNEYIEGWYNDPADRDEKIGFYYEPWDSGIRLRIKSSHDFIKNKPCVIFGQQHATKNEKFTYFKAGELSYGEFNYFRISPPRSYSKSYVKERSNGVFVAK